MLIPERERAMLSIRRALKSGGKLAAVVFSSPERNISVASSIGIARRHAGLPATVNEDPGRFALADPTVLRALFERAGFRTVAVQTEPIARRFPSVAEAVQYPLDAIPDLAKLMPGLNV